MNPSSLIPIVSLGSSNASTLPDAPAESLAHYWDSIDTSDLPSALLQAAALEQALHTTGTELIDLTDQPENSLSLAPQDDSPALPDTAAPTLMRMIKGDHKECLAEWFHLANLTAKRVPAHILPTLLDHGSRNVAARPSISKLVSTRGSWLAQQHPEWKWLTLQADSSLTISTENGEESWHTGDSSQRLSYLRSLLTQHNPKAATLIQQSWKNEDPTFKTQLIILISHILRPSDSLHPHEPWLQLASNDSRKEVRTAATATLLSFPSTYRARAVARAKQFISLKGKTIQITQPEEFDSAWLTDGIKRKIPVGSTKIKGEKAGWLRQILSRVPLSDWQEMLDTKTPLTKLQPDLDWTELITISLHDAALHTTDLAALLAYIKHNIHKNTIHPVITHNISLLDNSQTYTFITELLKTTPEQQTLNILQSIGIPPETPHPKITKFILKSLFKEKNNIYTNEARALALCIHPDEIPATLKTISKAKILSTPAEEFANLLEFRISYISTFQSL